MALRKIDIVPHPSLDKPSPPPDLLQKPFSSQPDPQKSPPFIDASPKPPLTPVDSVQRAPLAEKPQLSERPPKPLLKDLPPKPQIADLPPKPALSDRPGPSSVAMETQGSMMSAAESQSSIQQGEVSPRPAAEEGEKSPPGAVEMPVPLPRKINSVRVFEIKT